MAGCDADRTPWAAAMIKAFLRDAMLTTIASATDIPPIFKAEDREIIRLARHCHLAELLHVHASRSGRVPTTLTLFAFRGLPIACGPTIYQFSRNKLGKSGMIMVISDRKMLEVVLTDKDLDAVAGRAAPEDRSAGGAGPDRHREGNRR
jgi:hypothetical protein